MSRQQLTQEFNSFVKGLITEAGPLTFPENASLDESNFILNKDGSRKRRLGMDTELTGVGELISNTSNRRGLVTQAYAWRNVGGNTNKTFIVCQVGSSLLFYDTASGTLSDSLIQEDTGITADYEYASFASVNGMLIVANGEQSLQLYKYENGALSRFFYRLKIRDFFGLHVSIDGVDYREGNNVYKRYTGGVITPELDYNLRNQSWGLPRRVENLTLATDPVTGFYSSVSTWPSHADTVNAALYADPNNSENRLIERFFPKDLRDNPPSTGHAAVGNFIIDALNRGTSRFESYWQMISNYPSLSIYGGFAYKTDSSPKGAKAVREFAGRVFYAGFSDEVVDGDRHSPRLGSYVMFSQLVKSQDDFGKCYQEANPTSPDMSDLVATDGGFLRVEGAYNIQAMEVLNNALIVFAQNGVWAISGGSDYGFDATNYKVDKISERGIIAPKSVVNADNAIMFWGASGIFAVQPSETGGIGLTNLTTATIQSFYDSISAEDKLNCKAIYDSYKRQVRWLYSTDLTSTSPTKELVLDIGLGAFYPSVIDTTVGPRVVAPIVTPPFTEGLLVEPITVSGVTVTVGVTPVTLTRSVLKTALAETKYLTAINSTLNSVEVGFSLYKDQTFADWKSYNNIGKDAYAYVVTGYTTLNETQREKTNPYITFYFNKSEKGFELVSGEMVVINPSSCLVQSQWDWTNSVNSNKWGRTFQAYRQRRVYFPSGVDDEYEDGNSVVVTKNKLRGHGRALSLKLSTEPAKDCQILGWSQLITVESNV